MHQMKRPRGFTLIELLVVITIIAVLAGLIFSATASVRRNAQQTQCASNLRQIGIAMNLYASEHGNEFPETSHADDELSWFTRLRPYLKGGDKVAICPADPLGPQRLAAGTCSYVLNEYVAVPLTDPFGRVKENFRNRVSIEHPAKMIVVFPLADRLGVNATRDHTHSRKWKSWEAVLADIQPDRFRSDSSAEDRTKGRANYLYADGHVEAVEAAWLHAEIIAERNPAKPLP